MHKSLLLLPLVVSVLSIKLLGCSPGHESPKGFSLPQGDAVEGEKVFMQYQCMACHNLEGFDG
jgi:cytochrome c2